MATKLNLIPRNLLTLKPVKLNQTPGSLVYTGSHVKTPLTFDLIIYDVDQVQEYGQKSFKEICALIEQYDYTQTDSPNIWLNVTGLNHPEDMQTLMDYFDMPKFMMEEILTIHYHSKFIKHHSHLFQRLQMIWLSENQLSNESLSIYNHHQLLITFQEQVGDLFEGVRGRIRDNKGMIRQLETTYLHYALLNSLLEHYQMVLHTFNQKLDGIEQNIVDEEKVDQKELHSLRKGLLLLKTTIYPMEKCSQMYPVEGKDHDESLKVRWDKIDGQVQRLINSISIARELTNSLYETQMMNMSNDMNKVMTTLTIFSAIFIPLSFLAGVFGMNFITVPLLNQPYGFGVFMIACGLIAAAMIGFFKYNEWF